MEQRVLFEVMELRGLAETTALAFFSKRSVEMILAEIKRETLPEELVGVAVQLCLALFDKEVQEREQQGLHSLREGEVTITYGERLACAEMLAQFRGELNRFRKCGW